MAQVAPSASAPGARPRAAPAKSELLHQLADGILELTSSPAWTRWLRISRRFHRYSFQNQILIQRQCPEASWVAGYRTWLRSGRQVRRGERAIRILAPCVAAAEGRDEAEADSSRPAVVGFRVVRVFDISQTEGEELPQPTRTLTGDSPAVHLAQLAQRAQALDFSVNFTELWGSRNGDCSHALARIRVRQDLPPAHKLKTLAHEIAHAVLHGPDFQGSRALAELEAESVAYLICHEFGVDSSGYSFGYLASWSGGGPEAARLIAATARRILRGRDFVMAEAGTDGTGTADQPCPLTSS